MTTFSVDRNRSAVNSGLIRRYVFSQLHRSQREKLLPEIAHWTPEERAKIALLKAGMQGMLEAVKKGLRFRIVTEEIEPVGVKAEMSHE